MGAQPRYEPVSLGAPELAGTLTFRSRIVTAIELGKSKTCPAAFTCFTVAKG